MAKKNGKTRGTKGHDFDAPDGFDINIERERGEGWIKKEEGNVVLARILSRQEYRNKRGKTRAFYQLQLLQEAACQVPNPDFNEEAEEDSENPSMIDKVLSEGAIVNCDEFKKLEDLKPYTKDGGVYDVWFAIGEKIELDGGNSMWTVKGPRLKVVKKPNPDNATPF